MSQELEQYLKRTKPERDARKTLAWNFVKTKLLPLTDTPGGVDRLNEEFLERELGVFRADHQGEPGTDFSAEHIYGETMKVYFSAQDLRNTGIQVKGFESLEQVFEKLGNLNIGDVAKRTDIK